MEKSSGKEASIPPIRQSPCVSRVTEVHHNLNLQKEARAFDLGGVVVVQGFRLEGLVRQWWGHPGGDCSGSSGSSPGGGGRFSASSSSEVLQFGSDLHNL